MQLGIIGVVIAVILAGGALLFSGSNGGAEKEAMMQKEAVEKEAMMQKETEKDEMKKEEEAMKKDEVMIKKDDATMKKDGAMMVKGTIQDYSPEKLALAKNGKVLLFFHASWCPICRGLDAEAAANANIVPDGVTILKVDYDTATALKQKYGVTVQHTFVQVDASGALLKKFSDASKYDAVFAKVQ